MTAQWQVQQAPGGLWKSAFFINADTGFVVGPNTTGIRTTNGGREWVAKSLTGSVPAGNSLHFPSQAVGYIAGKKIMKTTDSGMTWRQVRVHPEMDRDYVSITFIDDTTGLAFGNCFVTDLGALADYDIVTTTDGGHLWTRPAIGPMGQLDGCPSQVLLYKNNRGYIASYWNEGMFRATSLWFSSDGGANWGWMPTWGRKPGTSFFRISSLCFSDSNTMWLGGARQVDRSPSEMKNKRVFRTQNANDLWNEIWDTVSYVFPYTVNTITFADSLRGFIGDTAGNIYSTTDGGTTWKNDNVPSDGRSINSIAIAGGTRVFAVGDGGLILRYDLLVSVQESNTSPPLRLYPNPTTGRVRVDVGDAEPAVITIIDMMGRVQNITVVLDNELDVSMLLTGTYIVVVRLGTTVSTEMLVKAGE